MNWKILLLFGVLLIGKIHCDGTGGFVPGGSNAGGDSNNGDPNAIVPSGGDPSSGGNPSSGGDPSSGGNPNTLRPGWPPVWPQWPPIGNPGDPSTAEPEATTDLPTLPSLPPGFWDTTQDPNPPIGGPIPGGPSTDEPEATTDDFYSWTLPSLPSLPPGFWDTTVDPNPPIVVDTTQDPNPPVIVDTTQDPNPPVIVDTTQDPVASLRETTTEDDIIGKPNLAPGQFDVNKLPHSGKPILDLTDTYEVFNGTSDWSKIVANKHGYFVLHPVQTANGKLIFDPFTIGQVLGYIYEVEEFNGQAPAHGWTIELMGRTAPTAIKKRSAKKRRFATLVFTKKASVVAKEEKEYWKKVIESAV